MRTRHQEPRSILISEQLRGRKDWGLCMNCANRSTCTFPRPKDGVLYCEEYE